MRKDWQQVPIFLKFYFSNSLDQRGSVNVSNRIISGEGSTSGGKTGNFFANGLIEEGVLEA